MAKSEREPESETERSPERESTRPRSTAEWTTLIGSLLVVVLLIGAAFYEHFGREERPGTWISVELAIEDAVQRDGAFYIPFTATNRGSEPAEDTSIVFEIKDGEETVEEATVVIPFLPNSGTADGELITSYDPATHVIEARPSTLLSP